MPRSKKEAEAKASVSILVMRDGVFVAEDVRMDEGDRCRCDPDIAQLLIERGHAKPA